MNRKEVEKEIRARLHAYPRLLDRVGVEGPAYENLVAKFMKKQSDGENASAGMYMLGSIYKFLSVA